uniref:Ig-like domain-containing protein n=1 Tax=Takifugu rubripes TaxID=31033 RepID=A0A674NPJ6_TAKRU
RRKQLCSLLSLIGQTGQPITSDVGDNVTLKCFYEDSFTKTLYWYKQVIGQKPKLMSSFYLFGQKASFTDEFRNSTRFQLVTENLQHHLTISDLRVADSATYYCLASNFFEYQFHDGTTVSVRGSGFNVPTSVHQLASGTIQSEDSMMLNCTVHTPTCDEEHAVYWFRNSGESLPGVIFTSAVRRNNKCDRKTNSCFFNLSLKNMNKSQTGTYYCGVASCQSIVFGAFTKIREFKMITLLLLLVHCEGRLDTMSLSVQGHTRIKRSSRKSSAERRVPFSHALILTRRKSIEKSSFKLILYLYILSCSQYSSKISFK